MTLDDDFDHVLGLAQAGDGGAISRIYRDLNPAVLRFLSAQAKDIGGGVKLVATTLEGADARTLREAVDQLKSTLGSCVIVLATVADGRVTLVAGVSQDLVTRMKAGDIVGQIAAQIGGRADFAQAGGTQPENLGAALVNAESMVRSRLAN